MKVLFVLVTFVLSSSTLTAVDPCNAHWCQPNGDIYLLTAPCRFVDTRWNGLSPIEPHGPGESGTPLYIVYDSRLSHCGVPESAKSLIINLTVIDPFANGSIHVDNGQNSNDPSVTWSMAYTKGKTRAGFIITTLDYGRFHPEVYTLLWVHTTHRVNIAIDITGWGE